MLNSMYRGYRKFDMWFDKNFVNPRMVTLLFIFTMVYGFCLK